MRPCLPRSTRGPSKGIGQRPDSRFHADCISVQAALWHNGAEGEYARMHSKTASAVRHRSCRAWLLAVLTAGGFFVLAGGAPRAQNAAAQTEKNATAPTGNADNGKKIFTKDGCYECHGREGQGAAQASGPRIGPPQRLIRPFIKYVRQPTGQMPPYTMEVISDQELADIYAYLQSRPRAAPPKDIPLLNQ